MKRALTIFSACFASIAFAADSFQEAVEAHTAAETQLLEVFEGLRQARAALTTVINTVSDPARQKRLNEAVAADEAAWEKLIESELVLRDGGRGAARQDIRRRRLIEAEFSAERARKLNEWAETITRDARK